MTALIIRADGGPAIGFGHITRCRALAFALKSRGARIYWLTRTPEIMPSSIASEFNLLALEEFDESRQILRLAKQVDASLLIGDWKTTDAQLSATLRAGGLGLALLGNQTGEARADLLVKQRFVTEQDTLDACLDGPDYFLLAPEFEALDRAPAAAPAQRVLVSLGGSKSPLIEKILRYCKRLGEETGLSIDQLQPGEDGRPHSASAVVERMQAADFAVLAGGTSLHEAAACRLPTLCLPIVTRQLDRASSWERLGYGRSLVPDTPNWEQVFGREFRAFAQDSALRNRAIERMRDTVDGRGAARVADALLSRWSGL